MTGFKAAFFCVLWASILFGSNAGAADRYITLASTTSTQNSGLFGYLLPHFTEKTGISVRVVAVGTGAAIRLARSGDADVLFVHHPPSEKAFVKEGYGLRRYEVMYNDFILVGPRKDPGKLRTRNDLSAALKSLSSGQHLFLSRGDDSGTHKREVALWQTIGFAPMQNSSAKWYREIGAGMGAALNMAAAMDAHTLSDRGTWLSFKNRRNLDILYEGDARLRNVYGIIAVSPKRHPHVKAAAADRFIKWILSTEAQKLIGAFKINGETLFHPMNLR